MLHDNPAELQNASTSRQSSVSDEVIAQIVSMGFDTDAVHAALHHFNCNVEQVINELVQRAGNVPDDWYQAVVASTERPSRNGTMSASHSSGSSDSGKGMYAYCVPL